MRVLLRVLAPLLGLALAALGALVVIEVAAAWVRPAATDGLVVPWMSWRSALDGLTWRDDPVPALAIGVAVLGLLLVLVGMLAGRHDVGLTARSPEVVVTTAPRVLARLVGRRVRASDDIAGASVTAAGRKVAVSARSWGEVTPELRQNVRKQVDDLLEELPLAHRPRVSVSVSAQKGPR